MSEAAIVVIVFIVSVFLSLSVAIVSYVVLEYVDSKRLVEMAKLAAEEARQGRTESEKQNE